MTPFGLGRTFRGLPHFASPEAAREPEADEWVAVEAKYLLDAQYDERI